MALMTRGAPLTMRWCLDCHRDPEPRLTEPAHLFDAVSQPAAQRGLKGLGRFYHLRTAALTDCSTCHH